MIISRTPYRISFFGGGTDYPQWYREEGGAVLSTTIDKYCYISCRVLPPFFDTKHRVVWYKIETVAKLDEIEHPAVREGLRLLGFDDSFGLEIDHQGDLPARSGIGSSSSFSVGLINALTALKGQMIGKHDLALKAIELEQVRLNENVGAQDQVAVAYGGLNVIRFSNGGDINVQPVTINPKRQGELESRLMLIFTGRSRTASNIAGGVISNIPNRKPTLRRIAKMVDESLGILNGAGELNDFGRLMHEGWMLKREMSKAVSNSAVDEIYTAARDSGALGGKLMGAGGSGFMAFYVPPESRDAVKGALGDLLHVEFSFERSGSSIIYYTPTTS